MVVLVVFHSHALEGRFSLFHGPSRLVRFNLSPVSDVTARSHQLRGRRNDSPFSVPCKYSSFSFYNQPYCRSTTLILTTSAISSSSINTTTIITTTATTTVIAIAGAATDAAAAAAVVIATTTCANIKISYYYHYLTKFSVIPLAFSILVVRSMKKQSLYLHPDWYAGNGALPSTCRSTFQLL